MSKFLKKWELDEEKVTKGVKTFFDTNDFGEEIYFYIAQQDVKANKKYAKMLEAEAKPMRRAIQAGTVSEEASTKMLAKVLAHTILTGWENWKDDNGKVVAYTPEIGYDLLITYPQIYSFVDDESRKISHYTKAEREDDAKN